MEVGANLVTRWTSHKRLVGDSAQNRGLSVTICNINIRILYICQLFYIQYTSVIHDCKSAQQCHLPWVLAPWKKMMPKKKRAALAHWSIVFHFLAYYLVQFTYSTYIAIYCVKVTYMLNTMAGSSQSGLLLIHRDYIYIEIENGEIWSRKWF